MPRKKKSLLEKYVDSATREFGRNLGKVVSNKVYGDRHSTPLRRVQGSGDRAARQASIIAERKAIASQEKELEIEENKLFVSVFEKKLNKLITLHQNIPCVNWKELLRDEEEPRRLTAEDENRIREEQFKVHLVPVYNRIANFNPVSFERGSLVSRIFRPGLKKTPWKRRDFSDKLDKDCKRLEALIEIANAQNEKAERMVSAFKEENEEEVKEYEELKNICNGLEENNPEFYLPALKLIISDESISRGLFDIIGCEAKNSGNECEIIIGVKDVEIIPENEMVLTSTGKRSERKYSESKRNEVYRDYVASATVSALVCCLASLPVNVAKVKTTVVRLDPRTGNLSRQCVIKSILERRRFEQINFERVHPFEVLSGFETTVKFSARKGFESLL